MDRLTEIFLGLWGKGKDQEVKPPVPLNERITQAQAHASAVEAGMQMDGVREDANALRVARNEVARLQNEQAASQPTTPLHPVVGYPGMQEHSAELPQPHLQEAA